MSDSPIILRSYDAELRPYEAGELSFTDGDVMFSPGVASPMTLCACCHESSTIPPSKYYWVNTPDGRKTINVCAPCVAACDGAPDPEDELKKRILARNAGPVAGAEPVAAKPPPWAAAPPARGLSIGVGSPQIAPGIVIPIRWVDSAAREWIRTPEQPPAPH